MAQEANSVKIREIFSILTQGVELVQYEVDLVSRKSQVNGRIVWMDSDTYRICVDTSRPAVVDRAKGKIPPGVYLRDICEVREGVDAFHFRDNSSQPKDPQHCLSLIGSERTVSLEFPSSFSRDWFYSRLVLLTDDVMTDEERREVKYKVFSAPPDVGDGAHIPNAFQLHEMLTTRGLEVLSHQRSGEITKGILSFDSKTKELLLVVPTKTYFNYFSKDTVYTMQLSDISEIRPGSHSYGFVKTNSTHMYDKTFSIISTEWIYDLEFISKTTRNMFVERLHDFCLVYSKATVANNDP